MTVTETDRGADGEGGHAQDPHRDASGTDRAGEEAGTG